MKKLRGSFCAKLIAIVLFTLLTVTFCLSFLGAAMLQSLGGYSRSYDDARNQMLDSIGYIMIHNAGWDYLQGRSAESICEGKDFRFEVYDRSGETRYFSNYKGESVIWSRDVMVDVPQPVILPGDEAGEYYPVTSTPEPTLTPVPTGTPVSPVEDAPIVDTEEVVHETYYKVKGYFLTRDEYPNDKISLYLKIFDCSYANRYALIVAAVVSLLLTILTLVFLLSAAGHRKGVDGIVPNFFDRIPYDIFILAMGTLIVSGAAMAAECFITEELFTFVCGSVLALCTLELGLMFLMSTATRFKTKTLLKNTLCWKIIAWCWGLMKKLLGAMGRLIRAVPLVRRGLFIYALVLIVEFFWIMICEHSVGGQLFGWFAERLAIGLLLIYSLLCIKKLRAGASALAQGNEAHRVDTKNMKGVFKEHADDLNSIGSGITKAVNERMKSERFKTELITNVSHDIKTPLTSIINYVDLMEKEEPENEKIREYLEVLSRQSAKLKKLIDDLMEASKASTGNLAVNLENCALGVLIDQTAGEYSERLTAGGLELIVTKPEEEVYIRADGRHMWRIFDNLLSNICKYAQPGTRVYLSLEKKEGKAFVSFRNISRVQLNISGEELMERFVRGDASRNTEGSGLGLSIARSLVQLQNGTMELIVDGDLFKIILSFEAI